MGRKVTIRQTLFHAIALHRAGWACAFRRLTF
jgi:hypothetical protein